MAKQTKQRTVKYPPKQGNLSRKEVKRVVKEVVDAGRKPREPTSYEYCLDNPRRNSSLATRRTQPPRSIKFRRLTGNPVRPCEASPQSHPGNLPTHPSRTSPMT